PRSRPRGTRRGPRTASCTSACLGENLSCWVERVSQPTGQHPRTARQPISRVGGQRGTATSSPFPTAPLRTGLATFTASGSPVRLYRNRVPSPPVVVDVQDDVGCPHHTFAQHNPDIRTNLPPFAVWPAFPTADYYGGSVAMRVAPGRPSRVPHAVA